MERAPRMGGKRPRKKVCMFCVDRVDVIDYKDIAKLRKCMTERAKILPRRVTRSEEHTSELQSPR